MTANTDIVSKMEKGITSIAINGSCHTVEDINADSFVVYSSFETLKRTTTGELKSGDTVNLELPLTPQSLLDGHIVQGHIDGIGKIVSFKKEGEAYLYTFNAPSDIVGFLVETPDIRYGKNLYNDNHRYHNLNNPRGRITSEHCC